ncbi:hypothetical protein CHL76_10065 [Marinococcus halophilus]|uniref:YvrJ family protein n=1 Tax=Marinococcus halophilus TaxID=1371 RepID=A0A510Y3Y1_MARHA|nr:hypothetical protein [Marinococcus halophilus]OZT80037.1 hypothetical protein CHL76_10065 [Marinococcus halophilus]GEK58040.1 hypothetical protein MHA01_09450 [Marinococcus halophilus]
MEEWIKLAGDQGAAVMLAFFLVYRMERKLDTLIWTVQRQNEQLFSFSGRPGALKNSTHAKKP